MKEISDIVSKNSPKKSSIGWRPDIDGLRALAVFAVFVFHAFPKVPVFKGGFVGVDVFFVISGFLISSIIYTDAYKSYDVLNFSEFKHYRINHSQRFADRLNHINGIENFWSQAKRHLRQFNGIPRSHFHLFLKECEWRFNHSDPLFEPVTISVDFYQR